SPKTPRLETPLLLRTAISNTTHERLLILPDVGGTERLEGPWRTSSPSPDFRALQETRRLCEVSMSVWRPALRLVGRAVLPRQSLTDRSCVSNTRAAQQAVNQIVVGSSPARGA